MRIRCKGGCNRFNKSDTLDLRTTSERGTIRADEQDLIIALLINSRLTLEELRAGSWLIAEQMPPHPKSHPASLLSLSFSTPPPPPPLSRSLLLSPPPRQHVHLVMMTMSFTEQKNPVTRPLARPSHLFSCREPSRDTSSDLGNEPLSGAGQELISDQQKGVGGRRWKEKSEG